MDSFFQRVDANTWKVKVSDVVEQNGGGCSFAYLPRTKSLRVSIIMDDIVDVKISQHECENFSIQVVRANSKTIVEFKCSIDADAKLESYDYPQTAYYTYLSGFIYIKKDCKFVTHISFIDQQDRYIVNEDREFYTSKFFSERATIETSKEDVQCMSGLKNKIGKWSSKLVHWCRKMITK